MRLPRPSSFFTHRVVPPYVCKGAGSRLSSMLQSLLKATRGHIKCTPVLYKITSERGQRLYKGVSAAWNQGRIEPPKAARGHATLVHPV